MHNPIRNILQWDEALHVGPHPLTGVTDYDYTPRFPLTATLYKLTHKIARPQRREADRQKLEAAMHAASD
jgi:hypothetical protein